MRLRIKVVLQMNLEVTEHLFFINQNSLFAHTYLAHSPRRYSSWNRASTTLGSWSTSKRVTDFKHEARTFLSCTMMYHKHSNAYAIWVEPNGCAKRLHFWLQCFSQSSKTNTLQSRRLDLMLLFSLRYWVRTMEVRFSEVIPVCILYLYFVEGSWRVDAHTRRRWHVHVLEYVAGACCWRGPWNRNRSNSVVHWSDRMPLRNRYFPNISSCCLGATQPRLPTCRSSAHGWGMLTTETLPCGAGDGTIVNFTIIVIIVIGGENIWGISGLIQHRRFRDCLLHIVHGPRVVPAPVVGARAWPPTKPIPAVRGLQRYYYCYYYTHAATFRKLVWRGSICSWWPWWMGLDQEVMAMSITLELNVKIPVAALQLLPSHLSPFLTTPQIHFPPTSPIGWFQARLKRLRRA